MGKKVFEDGNGYDPMKNKYIVSNNPLKQAKFVREHNEAEHKRVSTGIVLQKKKEKEGKLSTVDELILQETIGQEIAEAEAENQLRKVIEKEAKEAEYAPADEVEKEFKSSVEESQYNSFKDIQKRYDELSAKTYSGVQQKLFKKGQEQNMKPEVDDNWLESAGKNVSNTLFSALDIVGSHIGAAGSQFSDKNKFTEKEEQEYEVLKKQIAQVRNPILTKQKTALEEKKKQLESKLGTVKGIGQLSPFMNDKKSTQMAIVAYEDAIELYQDAIDNGGFISGLNNDLTGSLTLNISSIEETRRAKELTEKKLNGEELNEIENDFMESYEILGKAKQSSLNKNMSYKLGEGIKETGKFIGEIIVTNKIIGNVIPKLNVQPGMNAATVVKQPIGAAISPSTLIKTDEKYIQKYYENESNLKTINNSIKVLDSKVNNLLSKESLSKDEEVELSKLKIKKELFQEQKDELVSYSDSFVYGMSENLKERYSEIFVGGAVDKVGKSFLPALGSALNKSKVGSALVKTSTKVDDVLTKKLRTGRELLDRKLFDNTPGKLSKALVNHTGSAKVMHSLPAEMIEEIAVQLTPTYQEDYQEQFKELGKADFYTMVAAQTLILGGFNGTVGGANHFYNMKTDSNYRDDYNANQKNKKQLKEVYNRIDEATTDEQLAQDVAMSTMGTIFQINDYNGRIAELRNPKVDHKDGLTAEERIKKADMMERNSFYNLGVQSIETGTSTEFKKSLSMLSRNEKVSEETRANAALGLAKLSQLEDISEKHKNKVNYSSVMDLSIRENLNNETINDLDTKIQAVKKVADLEVQKFNKQNDLNEYFNLDKLLLKIESEEEQGEYNNYLAQLRKEDIPEVNQYLDLLLNKELLEKENNEVSKKLRYETNPNNAEAIRTREYDKVKKQLTSNVNVNNVDDVKAELTEKEIATPEVVQEINNKAIEDSNKAPEVSKEATVREFDTQITSEQIKEALPFDDLFGPQETIINKIAPVEDTPEQKAIRKDKLNKFTLEAARKKELEDNDVVDIIKLGEELPTEEEAARRAKLQKTINDKYDALIKAKEEETTGSQAAKEAHVFNQGSLFSPIEYDANNDEHVEKVKKFEKGFAQLISNNPGLTFQGLMGNVIRDAGELRVSNNFEIMAKAWNNVSAEKISPTEKDSFYERNFGSKDAASVLFGTEVQTQVSKPVTESVAVEQSVTPEVTALSLVTGQPVKLYKGRKFAEVGLKAGFLGLNYVENDTEKVTVDTSVNANALPFIDYRNFQVGDEVELTFNYEYLLNPENKVSKWENVNDVPTKTSITVGQLLEDLFPGKSYAELTQILRTNPETLLSNEEFLKAVPVGIKNNGLSDNGQDIITGGLNDYYWFNVSNVALKENAEGEKLIGEQRERIENNRKLNLETRKQILQNGSVTTKVTSRSQGESNKLLMLTNEEKAQGFSEQFQSISDAFKDGTMEEAQKHSALGVIKGKQIVSKGKPGEEKLISVNGKEVNTDQITNWESFTDEIAVREGSKQNVTGKIVMVVQSGIDELGNPTYVLHNVINNHKNKQEQFKVINEIKYKLINYSDILSGKKVGTPTEVEKANKIKTNIKNNFGIDITSKDVLNTILDFYPEQNKDKNGKVTQEFRQDMNPKLADLKRANNIPNLTIFESVAEFESAFLTNNIGTTTYSDILYSNMHTQYIYTGIENKGKKIWTNEVQPVIMFSNEHLDSKVVENITEQKEEQIIAQEVEITNKQIAFKQQLLAEEEDTDVKQELTNEIEELKAKVESIPTVRPTVKKEFDNTDTFQVVEHIVFKALSQLDVTGKITKEQIYKEVSNTFDNLVKELKAKGLEAEANFVLENKAEILGEGYYDNSIKEVIYAVFNLTEDGDVTDLTGENIKSHSKESYENNIADSLSLKVKILLSGIVDTRLDNVNNFAGLQSTMSFNDALDALQQIMSEVNNNTIADVKKAIQAKIELNEKEFEFYNQLLTRLNDIEKIDNSIINEILYSLYQPKVSMAFVLYHKNSDGSYSMETYDANTKNPLFVKRAKWQENFKNSSIVTKFEEGFYKINEEEYNKLNELYNDIIANENISDVKAYLEAVGVKLNSKIYEILEDKNHSSNSSLNTLVLSTTGIIKNINDNLKTAFESKKVLAFSNNVITDRKLQQQFNVLTFNNSRLNDLIHADNNVSFISMNMMYIGGKMINVYEQPKRISNILKKLKNDTNFRNQLKSSQISSDNFLLNLLEDDEKLNEYIDVVMVSLESLKERGSASSDKMSVTNLSNKDAFVTLFNLFASSEGAYANEEMKEKGIKLRKGMVNFPTLSDSSQLPLFKTILVDVQKENVLGNTLSEDMSDVLINQLLKGDLKRIGAFISSGVSTNIKGHDAGALFITSMSSLNSLAVDFVYESNGKEVKTKRTLVEVFRNNPEYHTEEGVQRFIDDYKSDIVEEINRNVNYEVNQYISEDGLTGLFKDNEIFAGDKLLFIDKKYLDGKGEMTPLEQARLVAYDYVINNLIQQKEIQTTFAGDIANYFKDNMAKDLINGHSVTNTQDIINFYYPGMDQQIKDLVADKNYQLLFERFPKLKFSNEYISSDISHEEQYQEFIPVIQMKTKKMFEDVQNNLSKRLKALISPGNQFPNSRGNKVYKQIMTQDVENSSEVLENLVELYHPELYSEVVNDLREFKVLDNIYENNRTEQEGKRHKALYNDLTGKLPMISGFFKTASTDAQEYTSWTDNLNQLLEQGRITTNEYNNLKDKLTKQEKDLDTTGTIKEENKLTKEERKLAMMQPTKPLYSGLHFENHNGYQLQRDIYVKSSSFAITPELASMFPKFNSLRKVINALENGSENTVVRISYDSANKVGAVKNAIPMSELYREDFDLNRINSSIVELDRENFYIQQDKPFKSDKNAEKGLVDTVTRATQFEKILLGDGINQIKNHVFPNMFDAELISELSIEVVDGKVNGPALKLLYNEIYKKEQKLFKENLFRKLGITDYSDLMNGNVASMEKLAELLSKRLTNKQDKKGLELTYHVKGYNQTFSKKEIIDKNLIPEKAEFKIPIFMTPNSRKFESVLNSVVNKNSINLSLPGFSSPVASQEGFDFKGYEGASSLEDLKAKGLVTTKNFDAKKGLQATRNEDGSLKYAQVFIANKYKVFDETTGQYNYIDLKEFIDENGQIDSTKLPEELLSMFSFRIPTSSHQSGVMIEVAGFLPHTVGDLMIVPKDHTVQLGEDYDIDTRYVYNYNYKQDANGNLKKLEYADLNTLGEDLESVKQEYEAYKKELFDEYFKTNVNTNKPLGKNTFVNNTYWNSNRETLLEIAILEDSLENYNEDKVLHAIFQDQYDFAPVASKEEMKDKIDELKAKLLPSDLVKSKATEMKKEYNSILKDLKDAYKNEAKQLRKSHYKYANSVRGKKDVEKVLQNNLVSLYKAVFSAEDKEVQSLINKTLSTDFAENTAKEMDKKLNTNTNNIYNIYSPLTQSKIMALGADGKMGIGVHSNAVTMNSLLQQTNADIKFVKNYNQDTGAPEFYKMLFGDLVFDGTLGKVTNRNFRISESGMESQNSATDNQKLQIMGRRNENAETINVFTILQATGLDNDGLKIKGQEMSYASLFINQPILREYTTLVKKYKSSTNDKKGNPEKLAIKELTQKYNAKVNKDNWILDDKKKPVVGIFKPEVLQRLGSNLTSEKLYNDLIMTEADILSQLYVLKRFNELKEPAKEYNRLQKFVNIENGGLGISYFDTIELMEEMIDIASGDIAITNSANMIGDLIYVESEEVRKDKEAKGYIFVKVSDAGSLVMIKPSNHYSHKIVNSIADGYNLWSSMFPYESRFINEQIGEITAISSVINDNEKKELKYKVISELKDYIYSNSPTLFNNNVLGKSNELFFDNNETGNTSLASYLLELSNNPQFNYLFNLPFFKDLQFDINEGTYPSTVKYNNNDISKLSNINTYNTLNKLVNSNKKLLDKNGVAYTEADLMKDLLMYSLLSNQENGAIGFRHLLPIELFDKYKVTENLRGKSDFKNPNIQNLLYNGLSKSVESLLGNQIDNTGVVSNINNVPVSEIYTLVSYINRQLNFDNKTTDNTYVKVVDDKGTVVFNNYSGEYQNSNFVRQFLQHNPELSNEIPFVVNNLDEPNAKMSEFQTLLRSNSILLEDFDKGLMTSFYKNPYYYAVKYKNDKIVSKRKIKSIGDLNINESLLEDSPKFISLRDKNGNVKLYELKEENYYEQITTLGTFGFNEYQAGRVINRSLVDKNNVKKFLVTKIVPTETAEFINANDIMTVIEETFKDKNHPYKALLDMFLPLVDISKVEIEVVPTLPGKAVYYNNKISVSQAYLDTLPTNKDLSDTLIEEILHSITVKAVGRYVDISDIDDSGKIVYKLKEGMTIPASLRTMLTIYQKGIDVIKNEQGLETLLSSVRKFRGISNANNSEQGSLVTNSAQEYDAYRVMDIHEFIAGIFRKDSNFATKMAKTSYLESGLSILKKYAETLVRLLYNIVPSKRLDSISANMALNLYDFLVEDKNYLEERYQASAYNNEANDAILAEAQKLLLDMEASENIGDTGNNSPIENVINTIKTKC